MLAENAAPANRRTAGMAHSSMEETSNSSEALGHCNAANGQIADRRVARSLSIAAA